MSSVVKTITPFLNKELLLQALDEVGCKYSAHGDTIITERVDLRGNQKFIWKNGRFFFEHEDDAWNYKWRDLNPRGYQPVSSFLKAVEKSYNSIYKRKLEEIERRRLLATVEAERKKIEDERIQFENERKAYVEKQKAAIIEKAKEQGYDVREEKVQEKIKLVLVRTTY
ncbi:hypothetical protein FACS189461_0630 [Spirochaetia bacterium]|nr:hypothetical protein FACS189461_0630 [Spirochaetia bacterium]